MRAEKNIFSGLMLSGEFWRNKLNWQESEVRSQELEEEKMSEPTCCVATQRVMAVMILIFMIEMQECAMARSNKKFICSFYSSSATWG